MWSCKYNTRRVERSDVYDNGFLYTFSSIMNPNYHFVSRTKTRDKIANMYNILIIYSSKNDTLESVKNKNIYKCIIMLQ